MNRITQAIKRTEEKLLSIPEQKKMELEASLTLSLTELKTYQEQKSLAQIKGKITLDEAMTIYNILNNYDSRTLAEKIVITKVMAELMA